MSDPTTRDATAGDPAVGAAERKVEANREQLADTVDALQAKLDVKSHAQDRVRELKDRATTESGRPRSDLVAGAAAVVLALSALVWWRRRR
jgi:hypothetical protein